MEQQQMSNPLNNLFSEIIKTNLKKLSKEEKLQLKEQKKQASLELKQQKKLQKQQEKLQLKEQKKQASLQLKEQKKQASLQLKEQKKLLKQQEKEQKKQQKLQEKEAFKKLSKEEKNKIREQKFQQKKEKMIQAIQEKEKLKQQQEISFLEKQQKMKNKLTNEIIIDDIFDQQYLNIRGLIFENKDLLVERLQQVFNEQGKIKIQFRCIILTEEEKIVYNEKGPIFKIIKKNFPVISDFNNQVVNNSEEQIIQTLQEFYQQYDEACLKLKNSSVKIVGVKYYLIKCLRFQQEIGSHIELEKIIQNKKACKNIENKDNYCLIYCYMLQMYINKISNQNNDQKIDLKHLERQNMYKFEIKDNILLIQSVNKVDISEEINIENINFPCSEKDIIKFSNRTKTNISVFEYKIDESELKLYPLINQYNELFEKNLDLLLIENEENQHLVLIKNYNALLRKDNGNNNQFFCRRCQCCFDKKQKMLYHYQLCVQNKKIVSRDIFPEEGKNDILKFKNLKQQVQIPFFFVADFESVLIKLNNQKKSIKNKNLKEVESYEKTEKIEKHEVLSYGLQIHSFDNKDDEYIDYVSNNSENVIQHFMNTIIQKALIFEERIEKINIPYNLTQQQQIELKNQEKICWICLKEFKDNKDKVIDHNHQDGKVRGIAHRNCNLQFNLHNSKIPILFHNLRNYDSHFIIQYIGKVIKQRVQKIDEEVKLLKQNYEQNKQRIVFLTKEKSQVKRIDCIIQNNEKVQSFSYDKIKFIDSYQFMNTSLQKLGEKLKPEQKQYTIQYIKNKYNFLSNERVYELINKGIFPYSYLDSYEKLQQTEFPKHQHFFSNLSQENISKKDYEFAKNLYQELNMKNFKEYLLFYQAIDVKLLTDVWINFRNECLNFYQLDPGYFVSSPSFSFTAMLKYTQVEIELIKDPEMYSMFQSSIRGGMSNVGSINYSKANNQYLENYDEKQEKKFIQYLDINNLYGFSMSQKLPVSDYKFIDNLTEQQIIDYDFNSDVGYLVQCDLIYPKEIHDYTNDYPLAVQKINTKNFQLSEYSQNIFKQICNEKDIQIVRSNIDKLIPNQFDKIDYICDIRVLQLYLSLGLKLKQIKKVIQFKQTDFLKKYIDFNTQQRNIAKQQKDDFKIDFFKLLNNSISGKCLQNVRNHANYKLVFDEKDMKKIINKRYFKNYIVINEDCLLVSLYKKEILLDKPLQIGACILDLSKHKMYNFFYNHIKKVYKDVKLIYTDTDSQILQISNEKDTYQTMIDNNQHYDFSGIKETSPLFSKLQQYFKDNNMDKQQQDKFILDSMNIGLAKDEQINDPISEFVAIKSKCYSYLSNSNTNTKKNKGVKKCVVEKEIKHQDYLECLFQNKTKTITQYQIRSYNHQLYTIKQEKLALQAFNDKRYQLDCVNSLPFGNYQTISN